MTRQSEVVALKDVVWKREGRMILNQINWQVIKGQHWVILGLNGSGKTSILNLLIGYQWCSKGEVHVLGQKFGQTNIPELRKSIGWVSSSVDERYTARGSDSALDVVISGKYASIGLFEQVTDEDCTRARHLLKELRIEHLANHSFLKLSQGEKRRVVIARALMAQPKLLILDEPCNGLDLYSREQLLETIERLSMVEGGPTLLYVTHHIEEVIPTISHVLLVNDGEVVAQGEKHKTLTKENLEKTFRLPITVKWQDERAWVTIKKDCS
ncbi:ABC transporter ATP-binding protein [Halalkalibacter krulwichiae]|uniref:Putative ABC transporter ATP-binding protein YlmA n=1 Tax=Halalkalibacter krulwichiae TaxID=199441 RepID=A0A1X9MDB2_9BACI|nr:ABC transporter ATP-binding protein [Halalkalibacter krulwichiae]ARK30624.1 putative ABC transporter ATP-binding protein YlmA [Halalkalibacter krulwichiae]